MLKWLLLNIFDAKCIIHTCNFIWSIDQCPPVAGRADGDILDMCGCEEEKTTVSRNNNNFIPGSLREFETMELILKWWRWWYNVDINGSSASVRNISIKSSSNYLTVRVSYPFKYFDSQWNTCPFKSRKPEKRYPFQAGTSRIGHYKWSLPHLPLVVACVVGVRK